MSGWLITVYAPRLFTVISETATRQIVKRLRKARWQPVRTHGSHTVWECPTREHQVSVPDGHSTISPGVHRTIDKALNACTH